MRWGLGPVFLLDFHHDALDDMDGIVVERPGQPTFPVG